MRHFEGKRFARVRADRLTDRQRQTDRTNLNATELAGAHSVRGQRLSVDRRDEVHLLTPIARVHSSVFKFKTSVVTNLKQ